MTTALVTGASAGLGREFAQQLAAAGHDLVIVARDETRLNLVKRDLEAAHGVRVEILVADLADRRALEQVAQRVAAEHQPITILVNNAGFGLRTSFIETPIDLEERAFDVMCRAVLVLSHAAATSMSARGSGTIINVSSVAGWLAGGTYSAAKAWVTVFTESLAGQLAGSGVKVTALCPGLTHTEFHERAGIHHQKRPGLMWSSATDVVSTCLADVAASKVISTPGWVYRGIRQVSRVLPRAVLRGSVVARRHRPNQ